jgi:hypothetical protein
MTGSLALKHSIALVVALAICGTAVANPFLADDSPHPEHTTKSRKATVSNKAAPTIAELREMGPAGLQAFLDTNRSQIEAAVIMSSIKPISPEQRELLSSLDSICKQKDCYASRLYWYTNLEQAKTAAEQQSKPILSLRLLGQLDQDLSCANSRLFRIALYANDQVSALLREKFILHWQSERPVPRVTIDFGDGRKMERTLTGNSIHYVLDSQGRLIDALPGLYGPQAFTRELESIAKEAAELRSAKNDEARIAALRSYHETRLIELEKAWAIDLKQANRLQAPSREIPKPGTPANPPSATFAARGAVSKAALVERPVLRGMSDNPGSLDSIGSDAGWTKIAELHARDAMIDSSTKSLMSFKDPGLVGSSLETAVNALQRAIALDTVRNEYIFRARIHQWLSSGTVRADVAALDEKVYSELFLTPAWDAWLGLRSEGSYSGIDNDGLHK